MKTNKKIAVVLLMCLCMNLVFSSTTYALTGSGLTGMGTGWLGKKPLDAPTDTVMMEADGTVHISSIEMTGETTARITVFSAFEITGCVFRINGGAGQNADLYFEGSPYEASFDINGLAPNTDNTIELSPSLQGADYLGVVVRPVDNTYTFSSAPLQVGTVGEVTTRSDAGNPLHLIWAPIQQATAYEVKLEGPDSKTFQSLRASAAVDGLQDGAAYSAKVRAKRGVIVGEWSNPVPVTTSILAQSGLLMPDASGTWDLLDQFSSAMMNANAASSSLNTRTVTWLVSPVVWQDLGLGEAFTSMFNITAELRADYDTPAPDGLKTTAVYTGSGSVGEFTIENVPFGSYLLYIKRPGYLARCMPVTITASDPAVIHLAPPGDADNGIFNLWPGDCDSNGIVNGLDSLLLMNSKNRTFFDSGYNPACDLNADGVIDSGDILILDDYTGRTLLDYPGGESTLEFIGDFNRAVTGLVFPVVWDDRDLGEAFTSAFNITVELRADYDTPAPDNLKTTAVYTGNDYVGEFTIENVPFGSYLLYIKRPGYLARCMPITVAASDQDVIHLAPPGDADNGIFKLWAGDCDDNGVIDARDILCITDKTNLNFFDSAYNSVCDLNGDGVINGLDILMLYDYVNKNLLDYPGGERTLEFPFPTGTVESADMTLDVKAGNLYSVVLTVSNIDTFTDKAFIVTYDDSKLEVVDFAAQTPEINSSIGVIPKTGLTVKSHENGEIELKSSKALANGKSFSGVLTIIKFKALADATDTHVTMTSREVEPSSTVSSINNVTASPTNLPGSGGNVTVTITGTDLLSAASVKLSAPGLSETNYTLVTHSDYAVVYSVSVPQNSQQQSKLYTFTAVLDDVWTDCAATVTVAAATAGQPSVTYVSASPAYLSNAGGSTTVRISGTNLQLADSLRLSAPGISSDAYTFVTSNQYSVVYNVTIPANAGTEPVSYTFTAILNDVTTNATADVVVLHVPAVVTGLDVIGTYLHHDALDSVDIYVSGYGFTNENVELTASGYSLSVYSDTSAGTTINDPEDPFSVGIYINGFHTGYSGGAHRQ